MGRGPRRRSRHGAADGEDADDEAQESNGHHAPLASRRTLRPTGLAVGSGCTSKSAAATSRAERVDSPSVTGTSRVSGSPSRSTSCGGRRTVGVAVAGRVAALFGSGSSFGLGFGVVAGFARGATAGAALGVGDDTTGVTVVGAGRRTRCGLCRRRDDRSVGCGRRARLRRGMRLPCRWSWTSWPQAPSRYVWTGWTADRPATAEGRRWRRARRRPT